MCLGSLVNKPQLNKPMHPQLNAFAWESDCECSDSQVPVFRTPTVQRFSEHANGRWLTGELTGESKYVLRRYIVGVHPGIVSTLLIARSGLRYEAPDEMIKTTRNEERGMP